MVYLVHHGEAADPSVDSQRALTAAGRAAVERLAREAAGRGVAPVEIWHSGKLRARQTGEAFRLACNPLAAFTMVRGLQPADPSDILADRLAGETGDLLLVGHMPHIARLLRRLLGRVGEDVAFPPHGVVALEPDPGGDPTRWREAWRLGPPFRLISVGGSGPQPAIDLDRPRAIEIADDEAHFGRRRP